MPRAKATGQTLPTKPLTAEERRQAIAEINARHQGGDIDAASAQAEIDELRGVRRVTDEQTGQVSVVDATAQDANDGTTGAGAATARTTASAGTTGRTTAGSAAASE